MRDNKSDRKTTEAQILEQANKSDLWAKVKAGLVSTAEYYKKTGMKTFFGKQRQYSKYTMADLRNMRTGVRNPKIAAQVNAMHDKWYAANKHRFAVTE